MKKLALLLILSALACTISGCSKASSTAAASPATTTATTTVTGIAMPAKVAVVTSK